jgi:(p)ppGpp synthase/HD superfamily hydrolase
MGRRQARRAAPSRAGEPSRRAVEDPDTLAAAALHDTIEDTTTDYDEITEQFNPTVARYVALLTKEKRLPAEERDARYFEGLAAAPPAVKLCKIADTIDNLRDVAGGGRREKALAKARMLVGMFGGDPALERALAVLGEVMARV